MTLDQPIRNGHWELGVSHKKLASLNLDASGTPGVNLDTWSMPLPSMEDKPQTLEKHPKSCQTGKLFNELD